MKKRRKHYTPEEKVAILRRHLVELTRNRRFGQRERGHHESFSLVSPYSSVSKPRGDSPFIMGKGIPIPGEERNSETCIAFPWEVDMHDIKERLSVLWLFALLNYLYADVIALWDIVGSRHSWSLPPGALMASAVLMEIPIAMILACRLLPFRANRLANIIAGSIVTLVNGFLTFVPPLVGWGRPPALPEYLFFATIETVCTSVIIWQAWTWSAVGDPQILAAMQDQGAPI